MTNLNGSRLAAARVALVFPVTFFVDDSAQSKTEVVMTDGQLARRIEAATADVKKSLPRLKLATFGDLRTGKNCLRHDANMVTLSGIEGDYDGGLISMDEAAGLARASGIAAIFHNTPRSTPAAPRWHVLALLSGPRPVTDRAALVSRLNGVLGGVLDGASWALSQVYHFGAEAGGAACRVVMVEGQAIDLRPDLDAGAIASPAAVKLAAMPPRVAGRPMAEVGDHRIGKIVEKACRDLSAAPADAGHSMRVKQAKWLGGLLHYGHFSVADIEDWLMAARPVAPADRGHDLETIRDGIRYGQAAPYTLEDRPLPDRAGHGGGRPVVVEAVVKQEQAGGVVKVSMFQGGGAGRDQAEQQPQTDGQDWHPSTAVDDAQVEARHECPVEPLSEVDAMVAAFNAKYMVVAEGGRTLVFRSIFVAEFSRQSFERKTFRDFRDLYLNQWVTTGTDKAGNPVRKPAGNVWLEHHDRKTYEDGVVFDPSNRHKPTQFNLWRGFGVQPAFGAWDLMQEHIHTILCGGNTEAFNYLMFWMANMVQHPERQAETAVVLQGAEGSGKGTLGNALKKIVGYHSHAISNSKHLTGAFNAHLRDVIFLFADEALFAGDKAHVGVLKSLITEPCIMIEGKYANAVEVPNYLHILMASNEKWVIPASLESRRFLMLEVADTRLKDLPYFKAIADQMETGGYEAMLHDLLAMDLSTFKVRDVPTTAGLQEQQKLSLPTTGKWWLDCLERGFVFQSRLGLDAHFGEWRDKVSTELLFSSYSLFAKDRGERRPESREGLGKFLVKMNAKASKERGGVVGEHLTDVANAYGELKRKAEPIRKERAHGYSFGDLQGARGDFLKATKLAVEWDGGDDTRTSDE